MQLFFLPRATQLLTFLALLIIDRAQGYTIDDSNTTVLQYIVDPSASAKWGPFGGRGGQVLQFTLPNGTVVSVDNSLCYDGTFTYGACHTSDGCKVTIPFTGSGATVYVFLEGNEGINISVTLDGGPSVISVVAPIPPFNHKANVSLYSIQSLNSGAHTLIVTVLDWNETFSGMMLDYIDVNETMTELNGSMTVTTSVGVRTPSPTTTPSNSASHPQAHTGAIIGGIIGGLAGIAIATILLRAVFRKQAKPNSPIHFNGIEHMPGTW